MNYCIIPKNNLEIEFFFKNMESNTKPYISSSNSYYLNNAISQIDNITNIEIKDKLFELTNTYEYVHKNVNGYTISVSKDNISNLFFDLIEIISSFDSLYNFLNSRTNLNIRIISNETDINLFHFIYGENDLSKNIINTDNNVQLLLDEFIYKSEYQHQHQHQIHIQNDNVIEPNVDFFIFSFKTSDYLDTNKYMFNMLLTLQIILRQQAVNGSTIIQIDTILNKILIDIIYILSSLYEKVYIIKPIVSNIMSNTRYLICSNLKKKVSTLNVQLEKMTESIMEKRDIGNLFSILKNSIPIYFINRIEDMNVYITHQQLDAYDNIINLSKSELNDSKLEIIKRQNILKCIQWCEKYKIPHNKFIDRVNIFLHP